MRMVQGNNGLWRGERCTLECQETPSYHESVRDALPFSILEGVWNCFPNPLLSPDRGTDRMGRHENTTH